MRIDGISVAHLLQFLTTSFGGIRFAIRALRVTPYRVDVGRFYLMSNKGMITVGDTPYGLGASR